MSNEQKNEILSTILTLLHRDDTDTSSDSDSSTEDFLITVSTSLNRLSENLTLDYTTENFVSLYRIHPKLFVDLASRYENSPFYRPNPIQGGGRPPITPEKQVLIFLWYAGQRQASCRTISEQFDISIDRACTVLSRIAAFLGTLADEGIIWQTEQQQREACKIYCQRSGIPNIIGAVDCFQVGIPTPKDNSTSYLNSSRSHSIQVQAICDHRLKFLDVFVGLPGSIEPAQVMEKSPIFSKLPQICKGKCIVGKTCYKVSPWCLVPYSDNELNSCQENFNACLENVLIDAQETICMVKERFPSLHYLHLRRLKLVCEFIMGCCILHNLSDISDMAMLTRNNEKSGHAYEMVGIESFLPSGENIRDSLAQQLFEDTFSEGDSNL